MTEAERFIRVLYPPEPPAVMETCHRFPVFRASSACPWPGFCSEIIAVIARSLGMGIDPVTMDVEKGHVDYGNNIDGNWTGILGSIQRGEIDTACLLYQYSYVREQTFSFSDSVYMTQMAVAVRRRDDAITSGMWEIFQSYSAYTWASMGLSLVIHILLCICIARTEVILRLRRNFDPGEIIWKLVNLQLVRPERTQFHSRAGQLALFVFAMTQCLLLLGLYQTYILSAIIRPLDAKPFKSANDLITNFATNKYRFVSYYPGHWFWDLVFRSPVSGFQSQAIVDGMGKWPLANVSSVDEALEFVAQGNFVLIAQFDDLAAFRLSREYCEIVFITEGLPEVGAHFVFRKGNPMMDKFNEAIEREAIPIMRIVRRYFANAEAERERMCGRAKDVQAEREARPLGIVPYLGLILLVGVGGVLAVLSLVVEIATHRRNRPKV